uniref:Enoyl reductase (ER) domain-containing protein n=1 Tax=Ditylum brightwellii TaxID=49249 RepID=A0A7S2A3G4_9STRA
MSSKPSIPAHPSGETMKAVCFTSFGKPDDVLSVQVIPKPFVSDADEVLIKVHAASLNPIDKWRVGGYLTEMFPEQHETSVLGYDVSGVIEQVGEEASKSFKVGDEVFVRLDGMKYGASAEYVVCSVPEIAKKPSNISFSEAASVPLVGLTALQSLRKGGVTEGSKVFIPAGAGGVGSLGIQIAKKMLKASHVCTTASPGAGFDICKKAGADRIIDYRSENFEEALAGEDFDMAFDLMTEAGRMGALLKKGGKIISITGNPNEDGAAENAAKQAGGTWEFLIMHPDGKDLAEIATYIESGEITTFVDMEAPSIDDFKAAVDRLWSGRSKGKCVIKIA